MMAKSKLVNANQQIAKKVTTGFQGLSKAVVHSYKKVEDKFVDQYLTKEGESVFEAKTRLDQEQKTRKEARFDKKKQHKEMNRLKKNK